MPVNVPPGQFNINQGTTSGGQIQGVGFGGAGLYQYQPPAKHLVNGLLAQYTSQGNPLMQQAQQRAMETSNARGQGSGAYAIGEAQRATIDSMLPVAQQDSETLTRIGMTNAQQAQEAANAQAQIDAMRNQGTQIHQMGSTPQEQMAHELQLQRERLAFEGEQGAMTRAQQESMGLFDLYGGLYGNQMDYANQRQLGYDRFGFDRALAGDQFGYSRGLRGDDFLYNSSLARQNADLDMRQSYANYQQGIGRDMAGFYQNIILGGMQVPEFMANPEAFFGFAQFATGQVPGTGANFFQNLYGGRG